MRDASPATHGLLAATALIHEQAKLHFVVIYLSLAVGKQQLRIATKRLYHLRLRLCAQNSANETTLKRAKNIKNERIEAIVKCM